MPRNGSGTYSLPEAPFVSGTTISSAAVNDDFSDIATALTGSLAANGETVITGQLKFPAGSALTPSHTFAGELTSGMYLNATGVVGIAGLAVSIVLFDSTDVGVGKKGAQFTYGNGAVPSPVGSVLDFAGSSAPVGWILCYGQAISRTDYPELFTVIGTTYGSGDGTTTFNLPDVRGRGIAGRDDMGGSAANRITTGGSGINGVALGAAGGAQTVTLITSNLPAYTPAGTIVSTDSGHTHQVGFVQALSGPGTFERIQNFIGSVGNYLSSVGNAIITSTFTGTAQGGSSSAVNNVQPTMIMNKIIFAGRP